MISSKKMGIISAAILAAGVFFAVGVRAADETGQQPSQPTGYLPQCHPVDALNDPNHVLPDGCGYKPSLNPAKLARQDEACVVADAMACELEAGDPQRVAAQLQRVQANAPDYYAMIVDRLQAYGYQVPASSGGQDD